MNPMGGKRIKRIARPLLAPSTRLTTGTGQTGPLPFRILGDRRAFLEGALNALGAAPVTGKTLSDRWRQAEIGANAMHRRALLVFLVEGGLVVTRDRRFTTEVEVVGMDLIWPGYLCAFWPTRSEAAFAAALLILDGDKGDAG